MFLLCFAMCIFLRSVWRPFRDFFGTCWELVQDLFWTSVFLIRVLFLLKAIKSYKKLVKAIKLKFIQLFQACWRNFRAKRNRRGWHANSQPLLPDSGISDPTHAHSACLSKPGISMLAPNLAAGTSWPDWAQIFTSANETPPCATRTRQ